MGSRKLIKATEHKAYRVEGILIGDDKKPMISIRQMYTTKKDPDNWMPGRNGITIDLELIARINKAISKVAELDTDEFTQVKIAAKE